MYLESTADKWKSHSVKTRCDECGNEYKAKISTAERQAGTVGHHQCKSCSSRRAGRKTAAKMSQTYSERWKGDSNPMMKPEVREKVSNALKDRPLSEEHKAALRKPKSKTEAIREAANRPEEVARRVKRATENNVAKRPEVREKISKTISEIYTSGRHWGHYFCGDVETSKTPNPIRCRSGLEKKFLEEVTSIEEVVKVESAEYLKIPYVFEGVNRKYLPDFRLETSDGSVFIVETKGSFLYHLAKECAKREALSNFCDVQGYTAVTLTEKDFKQWLSEQFQG